MTEKENFKSSEYYLAVTLLTLKEELVDIERNIDRKRAVFVFKKSSTLEKKIKDFRQGKILVEPQTLFMNHKILKGRLYNDY